MKFTGLQPFPPPPCLVFSHKHVTWPCWFVPSDLPQYDRPSTNSPIRVCIGWKADKDDEHRDTRLLPDEKQVVVIGRNARIFQQIRPANNVSVESTHSLLAYYLSVSCDSFSRSCKGYPSGLLCPLKECRSQRNCVRHDLAGYRERNSCPWRYRWSFTVAWLLRRFRITTTIPRHSSIHFNEL